MKAYGGRKMGEAEAELAKYMEYDPSKPPSTGAIDTGEGGTEQPGQPTTRDLLAVRNELKEQYMAAARLANRSDPAAWREAEQHWAHQLQSGASASLDKAIAALDNGDWGTVERALNHANGLIPNALLTDVDVADDGTITISGKDELTGEAVEDMTLTKKDLLELKVSMGDPTKALEIMNQKLSEAQARREAVLAAKREAAIDARDDADSRSKRRLEAAQAQEKLALANKHDRTLPGHTAEGQAESRLRSELLAQVKFVTESGAMNDDPALQHIYMRQQPELLRLANAVMAGGANPSDALAEAVDALRRYNTGADPTYNKQIDNILQGR
jgi:hypothetical protein